MANLKQNKSNQLASIYRTAAGYQNEENIKMGEGNYDDDMRGADSKERSFDHVQMRFGRHGLLTPNQNQVLKLFRVNPTSFFIALEKASSLGNINCFQQFRYDSKIFENNLLACI